MFLRAIVTREFESHPLRQNVAFRADGVFGSRFGDWQNSIDTLYRRLPESLALSPLGVSPKSFT